MCWLCTISSIPYPTTLALRLCLSVCVCVSHVVSCYTPLEKVAQLKAS